MIDENTFFRSATLSICGSLEIEKGMRACIRSMGDSIPVDQMFLETYEPDIGAMRTVAIATPDECSRVDLLTPFTESTREAIRNHVPDPDEVVVIDSEERSPVAREMLAFHGISGWSVMWMRLATESGVLGAAVVTAQGSDRYTEHHADLFQLLEDPFTIALANALIHREVMHLRDRLADDNRYLNRELLKVTGDEIVGADFGLRGVMSQVRQVAPTVSPVLLSGETGVGKDVIANAIHLGSPRRDGPFVPVNCGAIPESLLDSELFGHEKGAFTGALAMQRGRFERADGGTILLDEIGEMPLEAQVRLLRVIQHREIERVGGTQRIPVDIRIIAATNKNLEERVTTGRFREDLWFRLNVFPIPVPPLRDRIGDIPALVHYFIERKAAELKIGDTPRLAPGAIDDLLAYQWPGNVRELENLVERAMILHREGPLSFDDLGTGARPAAVPAPAPTGEEPLELDTVIARHIRRVLERTGGKIHGPGGAGELLGINPNTLRYRMQKLGIPFRKHQRGD